jgi:ADP-heptose:LPS heptosyltransferase
MRLTEHLPVQTPRGTGLDGLPRHSRVLVIRLRSMGDTVLLTPALKLLHGWRPDLEVSVLVEPPWDELLEGNPAIHSLLTLRSKVATAWRIRRSGFAAVVNLHGGPTSAWLTRISGAHLRAGYAHFRSPSAYTLRVPTAQEILRRSGAVHTAEHVASCFLWLGVQADEIPAAQVFPSPAVQEHVAGRLRAFGIGSGEGYAVIHPTALYHTKRWKAAAFAEVSEYLENVYGLRSVYICAESEVRTLDSVERHAPRPLLRAVNWPVRDLVALISGTRVFVGNDSGPAHVAAAARVPLVTIFGSSHSAVWGPWRAEKSAIVQNYFDCNPCPGDRCYVFAEPRCILSITTEQVRVCLDAVLSAHARGE